ncbi:Hypothetical predicted protein [Pelobates cultripes]|uniref:Uncharacterized protein n=1 Tax=Pelobates cultripes TaxID=61616 RepID=A0AAD1W9Q1_PELCU|nr:Hypothetical predicted protein [Pelobates cultripes]
MCLHSRQHKRKHTTPATQDETLPVWTPNMQGTLIRLPTANVAKPKTGAGSHGEDTTSRGSKRVTLSGNIQAFPTLGVG